MCLLFPSDLVENSIFYKFMGGCPPSSAGTSDNCLHKKLPPPHGNNQDCCFADIYKGNPFPHLNEANFNKLWESRGTEAPVFNATIANRDPHANPPRFVNLKDAIYFEFIMALDAMWAEKNGTNPPRSEIFSVQPPNPNANMAYVRNDDSREWVDVVGSVAQFIKANENDIIYLNIASDWNDTNWSVFQGTTTRGGINNMVEIVTGGVTTPNLKAVYAGGNILNIPAGTTFTGASGEGNTTIFSVEGHVTMQALNANQTTRFQNVEFHIRGDFHAPINHPTGWLSGNAVYISYLGHARIGGGGGTVGSPVNAPQVYEFSHMRGMESGKYYGIFASRREDHINFSVSESNPLEIFGLIIKNWFNVNNNTSVISGSHVLDLRALNQNNTFMRRLGDLLNPYNYYCSCPCSPVCPVHIVPCVHGGNCPICSKNHAHPDLCGTCPIHGSVCPPCVEHPPNICYYTVTFADYDGSILKTQYVLNGHAAIAPVVSRAGFVFGGWEDKNGTIINSFANITNPETFTAKWLRIGAVSTNGEGNVTSADITWLARCVAKHTGFSLTDRRIGNLAGVDRDPTSEDITLLLKWLVGYNFEELVAQTK